MVEVEGGRNKWLTFARHFGPLGLCQQAQQYGLGLQHRGVGVVSQRSSKKKLCSRPEEKPLLLGTQFSTYRGWRSRPWRGGSAGGGGWRGGGGAAGGGSGNHTLSSQRVLCQATLDVLCPYKGWTLYFTEGFIESSPSVEKIKVFEKYFSSKIQLYDKDEVERQGSVLVDYADLTGDQSVRGALPDLTTELKEQPETILNCLGLAIHQVHTHSHYTHACHLQVTMYTYNLCA
ncbi:DNA helicase MCM8-like [Anarrhichthys ocellatus]|uniref:DNA helicase MCM8-like n=1 Tax=Anarrhichthys ocellatus TaxID=433405 RepID=UPI0012EDB89B|nr:DNA helicase MCM8-like [Anarrhichthys ocellatus]